LLDNQQFVDAVEKCAVLADGLYGTDLANNLIIKFYPMGAVAGKASLRFDKYVLWLSQELCDKFPDEALKDTIPHEMAHLVCYKKPDLGNKHNAGWKAVCLALGGNGKQYHDLPLNCKTKYVFDDTDVVDKVKNIIHLLPNAPSIEVIAAIKQRLFLPRSIAAKYYFKYR
jgi:predicted SprT family Zn-dependent metalloprotease